MLGLHGGHAAGPLSDGGEWLSFTVGMAVVAGIAGLYVWMTRRLARGWSSWRTLAWLAGSAVVGLAISPLAAGRTGPTAHMAQHLLLGMVAPLGFVLAAPVTLVLASTVPSVRRRIVRILRWRLVRVVGHPVSAAVLSVGGLFVVMLTPLYSALERHPLVHQGVHLHYLTAGYLFVWSIAGPDPAPRRPGLPVRVAVLVVAAAAHSVLAKVLYGQAASLPMSQGHGIEAVQDAAQLMYYGGDLIEVVLAAMLFSWWFHGAAHRRVRRSVRS
jgi:putative membrane protein